MKRQARIVQLMKIALLAAVSLATQAYAGGPNRLGYKLGTFKLTYYWLVFEQDFEFKQEVPLYTPQHKEITRVSNEFAQQLTTEGTGVLRDGRIINIVQRCSFATHGWCFKIVNRQKAPYGYGSHGPLHPFRTVATNDARLPSGSVIYIPAFDGLAVPSADGGIEYHDGCFIVEDQGWSLENNNHIDVFVVARQFYRFFNRKLSGRNSVDVYISSPLCPSSAQALLDASQWARRLTAR